MLSWHCQGGIIQVSRGAASKGVTDNCQPMIGDTKSTITAHIYPCNDCSARDHRLLATSINRRCQKEPQAVNFGAAITAAEILRQERIRLRLGISLHQRRFFTACISLFMIPIVIEPNYDKNLTTLNIGTF